MCEALIKPMASKCAIVSRIRGLLGFNLTRTLTLLTESVKMKMISIAAAMVAVSTITANAGSLTQPAADPVIAAPAPVKNAASWAGGYVGASLGYGWGDSKFTDIDGYNATDETFSFDPDGWFGGAQAGYNWQNQNLVYGIEGDLGYLNIAGSASQPSSPADDTVGSISGGAYAGLSGRLGYAQNNTLFYLKAGGVYSDGKRKINDPCNTGSCGGGLISGSKTVGFGYQVGAGIEQALNDNWSVKAEYLYFDFGKETIRGRAPGGSDFNYKANLSASTVKLGVNYRF